MKKELFSLILLVSSMASAMMKPRKVNIDSDLQLCYYANYFWHTANSISENVDINVRCKSDKEGLTPLMIAAKNGNINFTKTLVRRGANVDLKNENGQTALDLAKMGLSDAIKGRVTVPVIGRSGAIERHVIIGEDRFNQIINFLESKTKK